MKRCILSVAIFLVVFAIVESSAQTIEQNTPTSFKTIKAARDYIEALKLQSPDSTKISGYKQFKRWEWFWSTRQMPDGTLPRPDIWIKSEKEYRVAYEASKKQRTQTLSDHSNWLPLGPTSSSGGYFGNGRLNCIAIEPLAGIKMWAGAAGGGLWYSNDSGYNWIAHPSVWPTMGVTDIDVSATGRYVYVLTGDGHVWDHSVSVGLLQSNDFGATFHPTGLTYEYFEYKKASRVVINKLLPEYLLVGTDDGLFRSGDTGVTWNKVLDLPIKDIEYKPNDPNFALCATNTGRVHYSTNNGESWTESTGLPVSDSKRVSISYVRGQPNIAYAVVVKINGGLRGVYRSIDNGVTWELRATSPNILDNTYAGTNPSGQGNYDLALWASNTNPDVLYVGGVNLWKSKDGGGTWGRISYWWEDSQGTAVVHADQHYAYQRSPSQYIWFCNDGGAYRYNTIDSTFVPRSNGLNITQFYRIGTSATHLNKTIGGSQDNSTWLHTGTTWSEVFRTGDGTECFIDNGDANTLYAASYDGTLSKSTNNGANWGPSSTTIQRGEGASWITPWLQHPSNNNLMFCAYQNVWRSTDAGAGWTKISTLPTSETRTLLAAAPSSAANLYVSTGTSHHRTTNQGTNWTSFSTPATGQVTRFEVHPTNPDVLYATMDGFVAGQKVFRSTNGGTSWTNISSGLPNVPVNCILFEKNTEEQLYVGTDLGVYVYDPNLVTWEPFNSGLPPIIVMDLEIQYNKGVLRAATYGRGLWESPLQISDVSPNVPVLLFPVNNSVAHPTDVRLRWRRVVGGLLYKLQVARSADFSVPMFDVDIADSSSTVPNLGGFDTLYWRVRATGTFGISDWSEVRRFRTKIGIPTQLAPPDNYTTDNDDVHFTVTTPKGGAWTHIQIDNGNGSWTGGKSYYSADTTALDTTMVPGKTYKWRARSVSADSDTSDYTAERTIIRNGAPVNLLLPEKGLTGQSVNQVFTWSKPKGATQFTLYLATDSLLQDIFIQRNSNTPSVPYNGLPLGTKFWWSVRSKLNTQDPGTMATDTFWFTTAMGSPRLIAPANSSTVTPPQVVLLWGATAQGNVYDVQVAQDAAFSTPETSLDGLTDTTVTLPNIQNDRTYYWRARARSQQDTSAWSAPFTFVTGAGIAPPVLISPENGWMRDKDTVVVLVWNRATTSATPLEYDVQISKNSVFDALRYDSRVADTTVDVSSSVYQQGSYYWRVRVVAAGTPYGWSAPRMFYDIISSVGDAESALSAGILVTPNPARDVLLVRSISTDIEAQIMLIDQSGKTVLEVGSYAIAKGGNVTLDTRNIPSGMYHIVVTVGKNRFAIPIVIVK